MADEKNPVELLLVARENIGLFIFEITGASARDGERYVKLQLGDTNYAMTAETARYLGSQLAKAGRVLPKTEFRRGENEG